MEEQYRQTMELKCFNCIHAPLCMAQKGGVNLGLASENDCCYYQPKLPQDAIVLDQEEWAIVHQQFAEALTNTHKQSRKDAITEFVAKLKNKTTTKVDGAQFTFAITHEMLDETLEECGIND